MLSGEGGAAGDEVGGCALKDDAAALVLLDALAGYGLAGPMHGRAAALADGARDLGSPVLSLDVPSGSHQLQLLSPTLGGAQIADVVNSRNC